MILSREFSIGYAIIYLARVLASHREGLGSIPGQDMTVLGPLVYDEDDLGQTLQYYRSINSKVCYVIRVTGSYPLSTQAIQSHDLHTDKKRKANFPHTKKIQNGAVAKVYMTNGLLIYGEIFAHFLIY
jgi:hypothetical protein